MCNETSKAQTDSCMSRCCYLYCSSMLSHCGEKKIPLFRWQFKNNLQTCLLTVVYLQISLPSWNKPEWADGTYTFSWRQAGLESRGNECRHRGPSAGNVLPQSPELRPRDFFFFFFHVNYIQGQNHMQLHWAIAKPSACSSCLQSAPET